MWWQKHRRSDFYKNKNVLKIDAFKILVSKKEPYGTNKSIKYFIEYNHDDFIRVLCIKLPQMIGYAKCFKNKNKNDNKNDNDNKTN